MAVKGHVTLGHGDQGFALLVQSHLYFAPGPVAERQLKESAQNDLTNSKLKPNIATKQRNRDTVESVTDFVTANFDTVNEHPNKTDIAIYRQISIKLILTNSR